MMAVAKGSREKPVALSFWLDPSIADLSPTGRLVAINLFCGTQANRIGMYRLDNKLAAAETGLGLEVYQSLRDEVIDRIGWRYDPHVEVILFRSHFRYHRPPNRNALVAWMSDLVRVPDTPLIVQWAGGIAARLPSALVAACAEEFAVSHAHRYRDAAGALALLEAGARPATSATAGGPPAASGEPARPNGWCRCGIPVSVPADEAYTCLAFLDVWRQYPSRERGAKSTAYKAWIKQSILGKTGCTKLYGVVADALEWQILRWEKRGKVEEFIPSPPMLATYLNQQRWTEEEVK